MENMIIDAQSSKPGGLLGVFAPASDVEGILRDGLRVLGHRGLGKGAATSMALSSGKSGIGQVAASAGEAVQRSTGPIEFALASTGNPTSSEKPYWAADNGLDRQSSSRSVASLVASRVAVTEALDSSLELALRALLPRLIGAFSIVFADCERLYGVRDPNGFRPLGLGKLENGWVLASETAALDAVGAVFVRDVEPGELVVIDKDGVKTLRPYDFEQIEPRICGRELTDFARLDSRIYGQGVHETRKRLGAELARQAPLPESLRHFDRPAVVVPVPDFGLLAAEGYAEVASLQVSNGLVRDHSASGRAASGSDLVVLGSNIEGKRVVLVDDSISSGVTAHRLVQRIRGAGAVEVHLRIAAPAFRYPCRYGVDMGNQGGLLAASLDQESMRSYLGADSLAFLSVVGMRSSIGVAGSGVCDACMTGDYPISVSMGPRRPTYEATS